MKILDRHIGVSVLLTTLFGVVVLSFILVLGNVFRELLDLIINRNLPLSSALSFVVLVLPFSLPFTIPWALLAATLLVFGRMSADNELVALGVCGVSMARFCAPVLLLALGLTGVCLWVNAEAAPRAERKMYTAIQEFIQNDPMAVFVPGEVVDWFPGRKIFVGGKDDEALTDIIIFETGPDDIPTRMIFAKKGTLHRDQRRGGLLVRLTEARFEDRDPADPLNLAKIRKGLSFQEGSSLLTAENRISEMDRRKRSLSAQTLPELSRLIAAGPEADLLKTKVEYHRRLSLALACLAFTLVGVPLGTIAHRKETSVGFAISLVVGFAYFLFIIMARTFENTPRAHPVLLIWLPNILFGLLGAFLFFKLSRR